MANNPTQLTILQDEIRRRYDTLSKRLKQVARYILDNSNSVAFDTVASIAQQADVPPSTLIRFANAFGFSGFNEMKQMFKQHLMEETANYPDLQVVVPLVNAKRREQFERIKAETAPDMIVHMLDGQARDAMIASDAALLASGTAALECMLAKCPMVVGYRMKPFTFWLAKRLVKTDYVSLPNLLAGRELVKELLQDECEPQALAAALQPLLADGKTSHEMHETFRALHQQIRCNADEQAADAVLELAKQ